MALHRVANPVVPEIWRHAEIAKLAAAIFMLVEAFDPHAIEGEDPNREVKRRAHVNGPAHGVGLCQLAGTGDRGSAIY